MLIIKIQNDGTGTAEVGNYRYQVLINSTVIESGDIKGHRRSSGWRKLVGRLLESSLFMMIGDYLEDELQAQIDKLTAERDEWKAENDRLASLLHNVNDQLAIATDLGSKRWQALNDIYFNGEKHNANWCKRKAQEGLGRKNG